MYFLLNPDALSALVLLPTLACLPLLFWPGDRYVRRYALLVSFLEVVLAGRIIARWLGGPGADEAVRQLGADGRPLAWIPSYGIHFDLGMDGISMPLVALTVLLLPIVVIASWNGIERHWRGFAISLFLLTTGILGSLLALDLFLFYVFWELMLVPMYLLIGIWGGQRRIYAAVKFFLFTMTGSLLMLVGILWLAWRFQELTGIWSFRYDDILTLQLPVHEQLWLFAAFGLAFAIKVPLVPLHTWLPDAHVEAPTGGSVILAGVLLKLGTYGFLRFALPLFPHAATRSTPLLLTLAVVGIVYGALVAWRQEDMKKLVAYSSVAHLGFVMLGLMAFDLLAWQGSLVQMINHGLSTGALFLLVGMLYERRHTKLFAEFGGLAKVMPWFAFFLVFSSLASVGLPGLNGFVGEFLILLGAYRSGYVVTVILATSGVVLAAVYLLKLLKETLWGALDESKNGALADLSLREILTLAPLCILMLVIGVAPNTFLKPSAPALEALLATCRARTEVSHVEEPRQLPLPGTKSAAALGIGGAAIYTR